MARIYNQWGGNPKGTPEDISRCIEEVWSSMHGYQCRRKRGHGKDGLYCKQHDPDRVAKKREEKRKIWRADYKKSEERCLRTQKALELVKNIPTNEISKCRLIRPD